MNQIFLVGGSTIYGVGGENGGWADMVKLALHKKMYSEGGIGEKYEVFIFGKAGANSDFSIKNFPRQLKEYGRDGKIITVVSTGGNDAKAKDKPDNFVSTIEDFSQKMAKLLDKLKEVSTDVVVVGGGYYDESKLNPRISPLDGRKSFFSNKRKKDFEEEIIKLCEKRNINFVEIEVDENTWKEKYLYKDGLHPNKEGYELISKNVLAELEKII